MSGGRAVNAAMLTELRSIDPKPVILFEIATGDSMEPWIRITNFDRDITFPSSGGNLYTARPFECTEVEISGTTTQGIEVTLPDVDLAIDTWLQSTDFRFAKVNRYLVERDSLDSAAKAIMDTFRMTSRTRGHFVATFRAEPLAAILSRIQVPKRTLSREDYPAIPSEGLIR